MRLQASTNFYNILYSGIILIFTGIFLEIMLVKIYYKQIDDSIKTERVIIEEEIERLDTVPDYSSIFGHQIEVSLMHGPVLKNNSFKNIIRSNPAKHINTLYRHHYFSKNRKNGMGYTISILKPLTELHKFKKVVMLSILFAFLILLAAFLGSGYFVSKRLWQPFYKTLDDISKFNLNAPIVLSFSETGINEFKQLNEIISSFSLKLRGDFIRMKSFTENLSHEINTMLAIIISKVELILQKEDMSSEQIEHFRTIYEITNNLIHLNNGLLLLAKIDNQYFINSEKINISSLIKQYIQTYDDLIKEKNLSVEINTIDIQIEMNKTLAGILISNIIINAIKHNIENGFLKVSLMEKSICVENSCKQQLDFPPDLAIQEYYKGKPFKSLGMGLEIIRRICRIYSFSLSVANENGKNQTDIGFLH
jgi:signal transduction histidine kinase